MEDSGGVYMNRCLGRIGLPKSLVKHGVLDISLIIYQFGIHWHCIPHKVRMTEIETTFFACSGYVRLKPLRSPVSGIYNFIIIFHRSLLSYRLPLTRRILRVMSNNISSI